MQPRAAGAVSDAALEQTLEALREATAEQRALAHEQRRAASEAAAERLAVARSDAVAELRSRSPRAQQHRPLPPPHQLVQLLDEPFQGNGSPRRGSRSSTQLLLPAAATVNAGSMLLPVDLALGSSTHELLQMVPQEISSRIPCLTGDQRGLSRSGSAHASPTGAAHAPAPASAKGGKAATAGKSSGGGGGGGGGSGGGGCGGGGGGGGKPHKKSGLHSSDSAPPDASERDACRARKKGSTPAALSCSEKRGGGAATATATRTTAMTCAEKRRASSAAAATTCHVSSSLLLEQHVYIIEQHVEGCDQQTQTAPPLATDVAAQTEASPRVATAAETQTAPPLSSDAAVQFSPASRDACMQARPSCCEAAAQTDAHGSIEHELAAVLKLAPGGSLSLSLQGGRVVVRTGGGFLKLEEFLRRYCSAAREGGRASAEEASHSSAAAAAAALEASLPVGSGSRVATVVRRGTKVGLADRDALLGA